MEQEQLNRCEDPSIPSQKLRFSPVAQDDIGVSEFTQSIVRS